MLGSTRKTKIEFFSKVQGLTEAYPITTARQTLPSWVNLARADYQQNKSDIHIARCPGIIDILTTGFIVHAWHDIEIQADETRVNMSMPSVTLNDVLGKDVMQVQRADSIAKFIPKRPWSNPNILKINTPWQIVAPKGVKFFMMPLPYNEHMMFECCQGILDPALSSDINLQGYWNARGSHLIKAGTPLAQLIPITEQQYDHVIRDATEHDLAWLEKRKYFDNIGFILNKSKIVQAYHKHFKRK
jgi:hypothetical protein